MEFVKSPDDGKSDSPSQEVIPQLQPMKRDVESLEDFEDITKDFPSVKNVTAEFLEFEARDRNPVQSNESHQWFGDTIGIETKNSDQKSDNWIHDSSQSDLMLNIAPSGDTNAFKETVNKDIPLPLFRAENSPTIHNSQCSMEMANALKGFDDSSSSFITSEQYEPDATKAKSDSPQHLLDDGKIEEEKQPVTDFLKEEKLVDLPKSDDVAKDFDDFSFSTKKGESSPVLFTAEDAEVAQKSVFDDTPNKGPNSPTLTKFISEPGLRRNYEPAAVEEDSFNVKETDDGDVSDNDGIAPEPIPKDYPEIGALEEKQLLGTFGLDTWFHPDLLHPKVESLVYWRDPKKSGVVFGSVMIILLSLTTFSLISVVAYSSLTVLTAALGFRIYKNVLQTVQKTSEGHPFKPYLLAVLNHSAVTTVFMSIKEYLDIDLTLNPDRAREISDSVVSYVNWAITKCRSLFLVEDVLDSIKFGVLLWCLTYVGSWFNGLSLIIIAFVGLFTLPKVYENNKTQIDANLGIVKSKINEIREKIKAVSPVGKKTEESKDKSE